MIPLMLQITGEKVRDCQRIFPRTENRSGQWHEHQKIDTKENGDDTTIGKAGNDICTRGRKKRNRGR